MNIIVTLGVTWQENWLDGINFPNGFFGVVRLAMVIVHLHYSNDIIVLLRQRQETDFYSEQERFQTRAQL
jgi:hypothetical protein